MAIKKIAFLLSFVTFFESTQFRRNGDAMTLSFVNTNQNGKIFLISLQIFFYALTFSLELHTYRGPR